MFLSSLFLLFISNFFFYLKNIFYFYFLFLFLFFLFFLLNMNFLNLNYEYNFCIISFDFLNLNFTLIFDVLSILFILLLFLLFSICILLVWNMHYKIKEMLYLLFFTSFFLLNIFCITNLFYFFLFFEILIIPIFFFIIIWGSRERRVNAAYQFFIYTFFGSIFMLISIFFFYSHFGSLDYRLLKFYSFSYERQLFFWLVFFLSISIKVPMLPLHIWLPEAHVEAPTVGSVILAGIVLKLGLFALIKFLFPIFSWASIVYSPIVIILSLVGIIYSSFIIFSQIDMKKIIAYSSISHMNFILLGLFSFNCQGIIGSILLMLAHGLTASGLFICIGSLYDRYKTRLFLYYGGFLRVMPLYSICFFLFILSNMSFPGTLNFVSEVCIFFGITLNNFIICFLSGFSIILTSIYSLSFYTYIVCGSLKIEFIKKFSDLSKREFFIMIVLIFFILFFGIFSNFLFKCLEFSIFLYLDNILYLMIN